MLRIVLAIACLIGARAATADCLALPPGPVPGGGVNQYRLGDWLGLDAKYLGNGQYLSVELGADGRPNLVQRLVPSSSGSPTVSSRASLPRATTYRLAQSIFLEPGFDWGGSHEGGKLGFGLAGGSAPSGGSYREDGFTARFMWRGNGDGTARVAVYSYAADRTMNLPYGDDYPVEGFDVPVGRWFTLDMELTTNSSWGADDGEVRVRVDGEERLVRPGIAWQSRPHGTSSGSPAVDALTYATFYGGNSWAWAPASTTRLRVRDVCWSAVR